MHDKFRYFSVISIPLTLTYFLIENVITYGNLPQSFPLRDWTQGLQMAFDLKSKMNENWANLTAVLLGFLWLIWVVERADDKRLRMQSLPDKLLFIYANMSYVLSYLAHFLWTTTLITSYWDSSTKECVPDVTSKFLECFSRSQFAFFVVGIICTALLIWFTKPRS